MADRNVQTFVCSECKHKNYHYQAGKKKAGVAKIELKKYCSTCKKHSLHKESK